MQPDLFELRRSRGIEQQEMAAHLGIHKATLSQIERGRYELGLARGQSYAQKLGVSLEEVAKAAAESRRRFVARKPKASPDPQIIPNVA